MLHSTVSGIIYIKNAEVALLTVFVLQHDINYCV